MRSRVSMVIRLPSRSRCTSLPSFTARRPKVYSAMSAWRQNSEIWFRIWSFFIALGLGPGWWAAAGGADVLPSSAHRGNAGLAPLMVRSGLARVSNHEATYGPILRDAHLGRAAQDEAGAC